MDDFDFYIDLSSRTQLSEECEDNIFGVKKYSINVMKNNEILGIKDEVIGKLSLTRLTTYGNAIETLDYSQETEVFMLVFKKNWDFTAKAKRAYNKSKNIKLWPPSGSIFVLDLIKLDKKYRGYGLSKKIFDSACDTLNIWDEFVLLNVFPLQHVNQNESFNEKQFTIDRKKLIKLYESWGFIQIHNDKSRSIMIKDTSYL